MTFTPVLSHPISLHDFATLTQRSLGRHINVYPKYRDSRAKIVNSDISQLKEQLFNDLPSSTSRERRPPETATNTIRRSGTKKRSAPQPPKTPRAQPTLDQQHSTDDLSHLSIRDPSQLVVGVPNTALTTTWRHHPNALVSSSVQYVAQYLGSTHVKELKGTESTMKSIQKLKKSTAEGAKVPKIVLSVSYRGVKFIDAQTQALVCEHEIRNIHCACQDADDLSHFAYITKRPGNQRTLLPRLQSTIQGVGHRDHPDAGGGVRGGLPAGPQRAALRQPVGRTEARPRPHQVQVRAPARQQVPLEWVFAHEITFHGAPADVGGRGVEQFRREPALRLRQRLGEGERIEKGLVELKSDSDERVVGPCREVEEEEGKEEEEEEEDEDDAGQSVSQSSQSVQSVSSVRVSVLASPKPSIFFCATFEINCQGFDLLKGGRRGGWGLARRHLSDLRRG
nr:uncharacterized protein LOC113829709 [Penaeus vannamei]